MGHQQLLALHLGKSKGCAATLFHTHDNGLLSRQKTFGQRVYYVVKMSVNAVLTIFSFECWKIQGLFSNINPSSNYQPPF